MAEMGIFQRNDQEVYRPGPARVSQTTFLGVTWFFVAISAVFLIARLCARLKVFRRLALDDILVILAWAMILVYAITWQIKIPILYWQTDLAAGKREFTEDFVPAYATFMPFVAVWNTLYRCCIWSVKFSFLVFFRGLNSKIRTHRVWWWIVFLLTWAGLIASLGVFSYHCTTGDITYIMSECPKKYQVDYQNATMYATMALDVFTDILILSIPILIIWNVQMRLRRKLILLGIFGMTIFIIIVSIVRCDLIKAHKKETSSIDYVYLWSGIEMGIAIIIANMASFRQLFISKSNQHLYGPGSTSSTWNLLNYLRSVTRRGSRSDSQHSSQEWSQEMERISHDGKRSGSQRAEYSIDVQAAA